MYFVWYSASLLLIINSCICDRICIDSCNFNHDFDASFTLPSTCNFTRREQCDVILTFDYSTRTINFQFGTLSQKKQDDDIIYMSELISSTIITLDEVSSTQNVVEYYCSTEDQCEYNYVINQVLSSYIHKTCHHFRVNLISLLHSDHSSTSRSCLIPSGDKLTCDKPCHLSFFNPNQIIRTCEEERVLQFETTIGRTTPINKPEYNYRIYAYSCTTDLCNGNDIENKIQKLIQSDDGECLIFLENLNQTTTTINPNHAIQSYSISFILFIICFCFLN